MAENTSNLTELTESQRKLEEAFKKSQDSRTTAEAETAKLNKVSQEAYKQTKLENEQAQNQFAQNISANQLTALDAIRRSNASAIANGANAGLSAANQLSSILGLQQDTSKEAADIANTSIDAAAKLNTQLNENAVTGTQTANELNAALGANEAELAKAIASNSAAIADIRSAEIAAAVEKAKAGITETQSKTTVQQQLEAEQREADYNRAINSLANITQGWQTGDGQTFATEYWDPFANNGQGAMQKGGTQDNQSGGEAKDMQRIAQKIQAELNKAYNSGDPAEIKKWTEHATKFATTMKTENDACLVPGTRITLADGSYKNVEDITDKDTLLVWDIVEGGWRKAPVLFVEHDPEEEREVIELEFDNNINLGIIDDHGLFNITLMKYVYIKTLEDAMQYIGHEFFYCGPECCIKKLKLNNVTVSRKKITAHSPCTAKHLCVIANDLLTMPGNTEPFTNVCDVDPDTLCYDSKQLSNYIETFGLFSEKDFEGILPPSIFFAFQGPLLKIKIAKGETSMEEINKLIERYSEYLR